MNSAMISLEDLLGGDYISAVCTARAVLTGENLEELRSLANTRVELLPQSFVDNQERLMPRVGQPVIAPFAAAGIGAATDSYKTAQNVAAAPLTGLGCFRIGEDGRLYYAAKSEHYHTPLGHSFPGYALIDLAKRLGIPNATHNNTRGYITRLCEQRLVAAAAGRTQDESVNDLIQSTEPHVLNRVINLETGSLAVEAALKMMLSRFYTITGTEAANVDRIPVFLVMADNAGGNAAGYHGTTLVAQTLRGLWPKYMQKLENAGAYRVVAVPINDSDAFSRIIREYNRPPFKTAGFCHEIIMMNYGALLLKQEYLQHAYEECHRHDTPTLCDEIQSCGWYDGVFLFRQYDINPDFLAIGKGLPGGNYPASRILCTAPYDNLIQFGALVTNGQEELASLSYLITMAFIARNGAIISSWGALFEEMLRGIASAFPTLCTGTAGHHHMSALCFANVGMAKRFCDMMQKIHGVDVSAQVYKPNCPPTALMKLPLITTPAMMQALGDIMSQCLEDMVKDVIYDY